MKEIRSSGWFAAPNAIFDSDLSVFEVAVVLNLYRRASGDGSSFPSYKRIAEDTGMSRSQAIRSVKSLNTKGWIIIEKRFDEDTNSYSSNVYTLNLPVTNGVVSHRNQGGVSQEPGVVPARNRKDYPSSKEHPEEDKSPREKVSSTISGNGKTEPENDSSSFTSLIEKMNTHLPDKPKKKHHDALVELFEEYGESITEGVEYAFAEGLAADEWYSGIKDGVPKSANWGSVMTALPDVLAAWARKRAEEARYPNLNDRPPCPSCGSSMFSQGSVQECRSCRKWFKLVEGKWETHEPKPILCPVCDEVIEKDEACLHPGIVEECGFCDNKWAIFSAEEIRYDGEGEPTPAPREVTCPKCDPEKHTMNITGKVKWYPNEEKPRSCSWYQCRAKLTPEEFEDAYAAKESTAMAGE